MAQKALQPFYKSKEWQNLRELLITERTSSDGVLYCQHCHRPILSNPELHHIKELTTSNVDDPSVSLNPDNILILHHECHNAQHQRYTTQTKKVILVYGPPCAGKIEYVREHAEPDDLIISTDLLYSAICNSPDFVNPPKLNPLVQALKRSMLDMVKTRKGNWRTAWIIESMPSKAKRKEALKVYRAEELLISSTIEECISRRKAEQRPPEFDEYIKKWFEQYSPS